MSNISYRRLRKYKYQLTEDYIIKIDIKKDASIGFVQLSSAGELCIKAKYAWDGPSGPTLDTKNFMRASLVHDALYQLIREGELNGKEDRAAADKIMKKLCLEDGMSRFRASYTFWAVRWFGISAAKPDNTESIIYNAPGNSE